MSIRYSNFYIRKRITCLILLFIPFFVSSTGQSCDEVLLAVNGREITKQEFVYHLKKNTSEINQKSINEYLESFILFQLKVAQANNLKLNQSIGFINELTEYRLQLLPEYLTDKDKEDEIAQEAYNRLHYELNASHILVQILPEDRPEDTANAFSTAMDIRNRIVSGEAFEDINIPALQNKRISRNSGKFDYFTALQTSYSFESAAYNMEPGTISLPIRTQFGFHIIKLNDKRKRDIAPYKEMETEIKTLIKEVKDERAQIIEDAFVERLKKEWDFKENSEVLEKLYELVDEKIFKGNWVPPSQLTLDEPVFSIDGKNISLNDFIQFTTDMEAKSMNLSLRDYLYSLYKKFVAVRLIKYENYKLSEKNPEFRFRYEEYRDAMLLLAITNEKVWSKETEAQEYLLNEWESELRTTYKVIINEEVLSSLWSN